MADTEQKQSTVTARYKKARIFRDFLIETDTVKMFKEDEKETAILFRSLYPLRENDKKQFMIIIDDSVYVTMQSMIIPQVPEEKRMEMLKLLNQIQLEYPTVKYVLTQTGQVMTSMVFHATEKHMDSAIMMRCILRFFEIVRENHYQRLLDVVNS